MEPNNRPIGVFDSGVGGLTVLEHLRTLMPNEHFLYIADLAHVPFGSKSLSEIWDINDQLFDFLIDCGTKMIVIACNTSSAVALEHDKGKYKTLSKSSR